MNSNFSIIQGSPYPLGSTIQEDKINFAVELHSTAECGVILYDKKTGSEIKIPFPFELKVGDIYCVNISPITFDDFYYNYYEDDKVLVDPYAKSIIGNEKWGKGCAETFLMGEFKKTINDLSQDKPLEIPYEDSIIYCMHVRGFTKHNSSKVKKKGTFSGIVEKIPYLKELGITAIEFLPIYEFDEIEKQVMNNSSDYMEQRYKEIISHPEDVPRKINYWGYKKAFYFAPKSSYCGTNDPVTELKEMIKKLHHNGIEVIMQFYFPDEIKQSYILEVLKYWVLEYRIDGIHLKGNNIPIILLATEPLFSRTKLLYFNFSINQVYSQTEIPKFRNLGAFKDDFMYDARKFLKGDEDMLSKILEHFRKNPAKIGQVNYITNYEGFTLYDLVSYERKHNEANGEENKDGNDYNYSWNCGQEGVTKKKAILDIRNKQIKNAMIILILSQGTPFILSGDEFGNSQKGNNNPYCQDNEISWLNWNQFLTNKEIFYFYRQLINLRKQHRIFRRSTEYTLMDSLGCSYPDVSYHSDEAWRAKLVNYNRHVGIMYCGIYEQEEVDFFVAYNMYWKPEKFALPKLPSGKKWYLITDTSLTESFLEKQISIKESNTIAKERSIQILISK